MNPWIYFFNHFLPLSALSWYTKQASSHPNEIVFRINRSTTLSVSQSQWFPFKHSPLIFPYFVLKTFPSPHPSWPSAENTAAGLHWCLKGWGRWGAYGEREEQRSGTGRRGSRSALGRWDWLYAGTLPTCIITRHHLSFLWKEKTCKSPFSFQLH